jgi:hypothetical protein
MHDNNCDMASFFRNTPPRDAAPIACRRLRHAQPPRSTLLTTHYQLERCLLVLLALLPPPICMAGPYERPEPKRAPM